MDPQLFAHWNDRCKSAHGHQCDRKGDPQQRVLGRSKWLIDTKTSSLVPAPSDTTYVALSYVWGQVESLQSTKSNIEQLCCPWSLLRDAVVVRIPPTIRDAIQAVRLLGERYLWVDSLCIIQDDEQTKKEQIMQMHAIYAGASITIVAAQGNDADFGLPGLPGGSRPRELVQDYLDIADGQILHERIFPLDTDEEAPWYDRGWTFQELVFSRNLLIFQHDSVRWECSSSSWYEDVEGEENRGQVADRHWQRRLRHQTYPDLCEYGDILQHYNQRKLTFQEDSLYAFSGVTS